MRTSVKVTSQWIIRGTVIGGLVLATACGIFLLKGRQKLIDLLTHTSQKPTEVYSAWLDLVPQEDTTQDYVLEMLHVLSYEEVKDRIEKPGQYRFSGSDIEVWTRGFDFPDQAATPAQMLSLTFWFGHLNRIETLPDRHSVPNWRLEPKRLARWSAKGGTSQPQVRIEELPPYVPRAILAVEDKRFYEHGAIDLRGLLRAVWVDLRHAHLRQGGSTISQQLSRSIFLDVNRTFTRKVLEAGLAFYLELFFKKSQLLEMYLNQVYWGQEGTESLLGLESASRSYFGKSAKELTLSESALLAGMLQSPNHYAPRTDITAARQRRNIVLVLMLSQKIITQDEFRLAIKEPIHPAPVTVRAGEAPYFVASLQETLLQKYSLGFLMTQGWHVYTTLDPVLQAKATSAVHPAEAQASLVAIDPRSGGIRVWVGGTDYGKSTFDRVIYAKRQPGSAFKPFVVLAALDSRQATEATLLEDQPFSIKGPTGVWSPQNYDRTYRGKVALWDALVNSINIPTVHLLQMTGAERVVDYAHRLGIQSALRAVPSLALGTSEVTLLELTSAYGTLANAGRLMEPYAIETIVDSEKRVVETHTPAPQDAVSPASAFLVTQMLQAVMVEGTAKLSKAYGFTHSAAGKTGTSENYQDAWFIGYTPRLVCGVWVGYDRPRALSRAAAGVALPIWTAFMQRAVSFWPDEKFAEPKELEWKSVDVNSGELARSGCVVRRKEAFLPGTAPTKMCTLHPGGLIGLFYRWKNK